MQRTLLINECLDQLILLAETGEQELLGDVSVLEDTVIDDQTRIVLLFDSRCCVSHTVSLPHIKTKELDQAIAFSLEEQIIGPVESQFFSFCPGDEPGSYHVLVCDRLWLEAKIDHYTHLGICLDGVFPLALALPLDADEWTLCCYEGVSHVRLGRAVVFGIDDEHLQQIIQTIEAKEQLPEAVLLYAADVLPWPGMPVELTHKPLNDLHYTVDMMDSSLNMLPQQQRRRRIGVKIGGSFGSGVVWAVTMMLLVAFGIPLVSWGVLQIHNHDANGRLESIEKEVFSKDSIDDSQLAHQTRQLRQGLQDIRLFFILDTIAQVQQKHSDVQLQSIDYRSHKVVLSLQAESVAKTSSWVSALQQRGLQFKQQVASKGKGRVILTVTIEGA